MKAKPDTAMVLAAGRGTRFLHLTKDRPKALITVAGRTLVDHQLDRLSDAGIARAVVNVHHFADQMQAHMAKRAGPPTIHISDERDALLETGGALVRARNMLGEAPFYVMNCDALWSTLGIDPLLALQEKFAALNTPAAVLLLARKEHTLGLETRGDFTLDSVGHLRRPDPGEVVPYYYAGTQLLSPGLLDGETERPFSANLLWDKALANGALYGVVLDGFWLHVGDPDALAAANLRLEQDVS